MSSIENIRKEFEAFVKVRCVDSVFTHLEQIFLYKNQDKICGTFNHGDIKVWISSNRVIGAFYPVVQLRFSEVNNRIVIKSSMNQVGLVLALLINVGVIWTALNLFVLGDGLTSTFILQRLIAFFIFIAIFNFPIYMSYKGARDVIINEIEGIVGR